MLCRTCGLEAELSDVKMSRSRWCILLLMLIVKYLSLHLATLPEQSKY